MQTHSLPIASAAPAPPSGDAARLSRLSEWQFRTLLLAIGAVSAAMAADGLQSFARLAETRVVQGVRTEAVSPVLYGAELPALHALAPADGRGPRVIVRADAAGAEAAGICELARAAGLGIRWVALSPDVTACVPAPVARASKPAETEMAAARWVVLDERGAALYSSRQVPTVDHLRAIVSLLTPAAPPAAEADEPLPGLMKESR